MAGVLPGDAGRLRKLLLRSQGSVAPLVAKAKQGDKDAIASALQHLQFQNDIQLQIIEALVSGGESLTVLGVRDEPIGWIGSAADKVGAWFKTLYVGGTGPDDAELVADADGNLTITGGITAASLSLWIPLIDALTLTDNSPASGRIAWAACALYFAGTTYNIAAGNTSSSSHKHVYWVRGNSTFTSAVEMPVDVDNYLIATNNGGVADIALGKVGADKSITESALVPNLLKGIAIQPVTDSFRSLTVIGSTTLLSVSSGGGALLGIHCYVETSIAGAGSLNVYIDITVDGGTTQSLQLYSTTIPGVALGIWNAISNVRSGDMSTAGDYRTMSVLSMPFSNSITVVIRTSGGGASSGLLSLNVVYGLKTSL